MSDSDDLAELDLDRVSINSSDFESTDPEAETDDEISEPEDIFKFLDQHNRGYITKEDFYKAYLCCTKEEPGKDKMKKISETAVDGKINLEQFILLWEESEVDSDKQSVEAET